MNLKEAELLRIEFQEIRNKDYSWIKDKNIWDKIKQLRLFYEENNIPQTDLNKSILEDKAERFP